MSGLTVELLEGKRRKQRHVRWPAIFAEVANRLVAAYGEPALGNFADPVQEIFYILLSAKTADAQYRRTHAALTTRFPRLSDLAAASASEVLACIRSGGFGRAKADRLTRIAKKLLELERTLPPSCVP
jgi:endonuclease III